MAKNEKEVEYKKSNSELSFVETFNINNHYNHHDQEHGMQDHYEAKWSKQNKYRREEEEEEEEECFEKMFESEEVPSWRRQLSVRAFVVSLVLGVIFSFILMKLNLTTGIIPSLNVSAGLLGFFLVKTWTQLLHQAGLLRHPFTRQENTVIQTCVVATSGIAFSGGFGSYLFAMSDIIAEQSTEANDIKNVKNPSLGWMIGFLFVVSFLGLFTVVPLRKIMILDFRLIYPSGMATAYLINSFHTPQGAKLAKKQVRQLAKFFSFSFLWGFFQWFFTAGKNCGFASFPTFGLQAYQNRFYFDFSATYVGVGMICPYLINASLLVGAILSWGIMWPLIDKQKGHWFASDLSPDSLRGLEGYKVFLAIAMILGDGAYNFFKVLGGTIFGLHKQLKHKDLGKVFPTSSPRMKTANMPYDDQRRINPFLQDQIPWWTATSCYVIIAIISVLTIPHIFHPVKWYYIVSIYVMAPILAFCNAYGCGLTDMSLASTYGKLAILVVGAWAGTHNDGVLVGLAACGVMMNIVSTASDLMQDFKTGYLTLASPRSMFVSQVIGTSMGCVISPCVFWLFYKSSPSIGQQGSEYPAPNALVYRNMAVLGAEGFSSLPKHCLTLCYSFFIAAIVINGIRDVVGSDRARYIPLPMAMAIPFYLGAYFAIDMCVGCLILFVWKKLNRANADVFGTAVASGLICGDGIWSLPSSILALAGINPPICMKFLSGSTNAKVDAILNS